MPMVASVTMIGGIAANATKAPFASPKAQPITMQIASASTPFIPACIRPAAMVPDSAITAPTDRSMPPVRITNVMPTAISALIETWRRMLVMLL